MSSWSTNDEGDKRLVLVIRKDIALVMACPVCMQQLEVTVDGVKHGHFEGVVKFLAEHSAHFTSPGHVVTAIDRGKVRAAMELLKQSIL